MDSQMDSLYALRNSEPSCDFLEVMNGPEDGRRIEITKDEITIGRHPDNDFCIPLELSVSRKHARLVKVNDVYQLEILSAAKNAGRIVDMDLPPGSSGTIRPGQSFVLGDVTIELGSAR